jgi:hypothetical protein
MECAESGVALRARDEDVVARATPLRYYRRTSALSRASPNRSHLPGEHD